MKKTLLFISAIITSLLMSRDVAAQVIFNVTNPPPLAGTYDFTAVDAGTWGVDMSTVFIEDTLVLVRDFTTADSLGCDTNGYVNAAQIAGNIAVVYRGTCEFGRKALNAQNAGAIGVVIINNIAGPPIAMGAGAVGSQVTIPVIMISQATGALLRPEIDNMNVTAMIGNKTGVFNNDLGAFRQDVVLANSWAIPSGLATNGSAFSIPVGAWVTNYGINNQPNTTLTATISLGGNVLYNQTSAPVSIVSGDSTFISLSNFSEPTYADGLYRLEYTMSGGTADDFPDDNSIVTHFWIQPDHYSKNRWDTTTFQPIRTTHYRTADAVDEFTWCTVLDHPDSGNLTAYGVSFSATAATTSTLANKSMQVHLYEWNDVIVDTMTFDNLNSLVEDQYYDYIDNTESGLFVTVWFTDPLTGLPSPVQLSNNTKYLTCVKTFDTDVFIGADDFIDYETSWDAYNPSATQFDDLSVFFPTRGTTNQVDDWNGVGFGSTPVPSIILHTSPVGLVIGVDENTASSVKFPYPNPGNDFINIPLKKTYNGKVTVDIYDITGRTVKSEVVNMNNTSDFRIRTNQMTNGVYQFNLKFSDGSVANFPVVINR